MTAIVIPTQDIIKCTVTSGRAQSLTVIYAIGATRTSGNTSLLLNALFVCVLYITIAVQNAIRVLMGGQRRNWVIVRPAEASHP